VDSRTPLGDAAPIAAHVIRWTGTAGSLILGNHRLARLLRDRALTLIADDGSSGEILLVRPDAHLGWSGRAGPDALDRWLTAMTRQGRAR